MAFFNLTHMGVQDPFKTASTSGPEQSSCQPQPAPLRSPEATDSSSDEEKRSPVASPNTVGGHAQSPLSTPQKDQTTIDLPSASNGAEQWHSGSHTKYTELLRKHQRNPSGPSDLYQHPVTTSHSYGWWMKHGRPEKEDWSLGERRAHVNSEMTRSVLSA